MHDPNFCHARLYSDTKVATQYLCPKRVRERHRHTWPTASPRTAVE